MKSRYYVLNGKKVEPATLFDWAVFMGHADRSVAQTIVQGFLVSTVFLGLDHRRWSSDPVGNDGVRSGRTCSRFHVGPLRWLLGASRSDARKGGRIGPICFRDSCSGATTQRQALSYPSPCRSNLPTLFATS